MTEIYAYPKIKRISNEELLGLSEEDVRSIAESIAANFVNQLNEQFNILNFQHNNSELYEKDMIFIRNAVESTILRMVGVYYDFQDLVDNVMEDSFDEKDETENTDKDEE